MKMGVKMGGKREARAACGPGTLASEILTPKGSQGELSRQRFWPPWCATRVHFGRSLGIFVGLGRVDFLA